jgi:hypothetical protein
MCAMKKLGVIANQIKLHKKLFKDDKKIKGLNFQYEN